MGVGKKLGRFDFADLEVVGCSCQCETIGRAAGSSPAGANRSRSGCDGMLHRRLFFKKVFALIVRVITNSTKYYCTPHTTWRRTDDVTTQLRPHPFVAFFFDPEDHSSRPRSADHSSRPVVRGLLIQDVRPLLCPSFQAFECSSASCRPNGTAIRLANVG